MMHTRSFSFFDIIKTHEEGAQSEPKNYLIYACLYEIILFLHFQPLRGKMKKNYLKCQLVQLFEFFSQPTKTQETLEKLQRGY